MKITTFIILFSLVKITQSNLFSQTWVQKQDFPDGIGRKNAVSFNINEEVYVGTGLGTSHTRDFYKYIPSTNSWINLPPLPADSRTDAIGFSLNGNGYCGTGNLATNNTSNDLYKYVPQTNSWNYNSAVGPSGLESAVSFILNGKAYVTLGTTNNQFFTPNYNTNTYEYNSTASTWGSVGVWPQNFGPGLKEASAFVLNNHAYVYGGNSRGTDGARYSSSEVIEFTTSYQWNYIGQAPTSNFENARSGAAVVTTANSAYFIGGFYACTEQGNWECFTKKVLKWYQPSNTWTELTSEYPQGYYSYGVGITNCGKNYVGLGVARTSSASVTETLPKSYYQYQLPIDNIITGPAVVCNSNTTFTVQNPDNVPITWVVSGNIDIISGQGTNSLVVKQKQTNNGAGSLQPTLVYCNNNIVVPQTNVWVGKPYLSSLTYDGQLPPNSCSMGFYQTFTGGDHVLTAIAQGATGNPSLILNTFGSPYVHGDANGNNFNFNTNSKHLNAFEFTISSNFNNACGSASSCTYFTNWASLISPFPNPSESEFMLQLGGEDNLKNIAVYNSTQEQVFTTATTEKELKIGTRQLPDGMYVVKIIIKDKILTYRLQIKH